MKVICRCGELYPDAPEKLQFNETLKRVFDRLVSDLITNTRTRVVEAGVHSLEAIRRHPERLAAFSPDSRRGPAPVKEFLIREPLLQSALEGEKEDAERIVGELFAHWMEEPEDLPRNYREKTGEDSLPRVICDYIAGMTDPFIYQQYEKYCA